MPRLAFVLRARWQSPAEPLLPLTLRDILPTVERHVMLRAASVIRAYPTRTTMHDARWDNLTDAEWAAFAMAWNAELSGEVPSAPLPALPWLLDDPPKTASGYVVPMNFTASPNAQWKFIVAAFASGNENTHGHLAAGPVEHLLGNHGDRYIESFEKMAADDPRFAGMLKGCNQYRMSEEVWRRLRNARGDVG